MPNFLITHRGEMWARNTANIEAVLGRKKGGQGIYILFDGSAPVYVGRGNILHRIRRLEIVRAKDGERSRRIAAQDPL